MTKGKIIALLGQAGSGKDTAGRIIAEVTGGTTISLADPLKRFCKEVFDFSDEQLWGPSHMRNAADERYVRKTENMVVNGREVVDEQGNVVGFEQDTMQRSVFLTPRYALQTLGTEWGRDCYGNVWIDYGIRKAKKLLTLGEGTGGKVDSYPVVVITDCRFLNEAKAITEAGGEIWRIVRPGSMAAGGIAGHASEAEQNDPSMDLYVSKVIQNNGTIEEFEVLVRSLAKGL